MSVGRETSESIPWTRQHSTRTRGTHTTRGASRLYHEHERRVLRVLSLSLSPRPRSLYVVKFFRDDGHHRSPGAARSGPLSSLSGTCPGTYPDPSDETSLFVPFFTVRRSTRHEPMNEPVAPKLLSPPFVLASCQSSGLFSI